MKNMCIYGYYIHSSFIKGHTLFRITGRRCYSLFMMDIYQTEKFSEVFLLLKVTLYMIFIKDGHFVFITNNNNNNNNSNNNNNNLIALI